MPFIFHGSCPDALRLPGMSCEMDPVHRIAIGEC
jgi:hypothetical protein